jgi:pilus assembly protein CpaB
VDVILTRAQKTAGVENYVAETLLTNVRVLAIDQQIEEKSGQRVVVGKIALLELEPQQAETIAVARRMGTLSLILRSLADSTTPDAIENPENRQRVINIVRAGQSTPALSK